MKSISVSKSHLATITLGIFAALLFLTTPVPAVATPPATTDLTLQQQLERAKTLSDEATVKATLALETGDLALAQEAQALAAEAANIVSAIAVIAADTGDTALAQAALNASVGVSTSLSIIAGAAETIAATSTDAETVAAANALATMVATSQEITTTAQETAVAAGASMAAAEEAYEPPGALAARPGFNPAVAGAALPITDLPPASPI